MRIAMIGSRGIPARIGGVEHVVESLTSHLTRKGHEVLVYGRAHYLEGAGEPDEGRCIVTAGVSGKHLDTFTHSASAAWDVLRRGVDIVHVHSPGPALWSWLPALAGVPIVFTVHAPDWEREKWSLPAKFVIRGGLSVGMKCAQAVTAVSVNLAEELSKKFGRAVRCVPNGAEPAEALEPDLIRQWGLKKDGFALHVGRIVPEKRLHILLQAWEQAELPIPLVIAAEDSEKEYARQCRHNAPESVHFIGPQHGKILAELYSNAAMVVQPSLLEGASLVLLESASYGRCVVLTDIPANREILGEEGLYFSGKNVDELAGELGRCFSEVSLREEIGLRGRQRVLEKFSMSDVAARMEAVYEDVLEKMNG